MPHEAPLQILLVDDDPIALYTNAKILLSLGFSVRQAASGAEAITLLAKHHFDAAVVDIRMPGVTGHDVAHVARLEHRAIFLVALSGFDRPEDVLTSLDAGFDVHFSKSIPLDRLARSLHALRRQQ